MASQRADIGRYEARRGVPRPPPQPTGTMGPPGPCPVPLAPWGDAQAPEPRPIQQAARSAVSLVWPCVGDLHPPTHLGWEWEVPTTPGATRGHWGGVGRVSRRRGASMAKKSLQWVVLGQNPSESLTIHPALRHLELQHSSSGLLADLAAGDMCSLLVQGVGGGN